MRPVGLAALKGEGTATQFDNAAGERFIWNVDMVAIGLGFAITREALDDNLYKDQFNPQSMGLADLLRRLGKSCTRTSSITAPRSSRQ